MLNLHKNNVIKAIFAFLAVGIFGFYTASIVTMHHADMGTMAHCPVLVSEIDYCTQTQGSAACVDYHLSLLHNFSEAVFGHISHSMAALLLGMLCIFFGVVFNTSYTLHGRLRTRLKQLREDTIDVLPIQLGRWLVLFEKRDPSLAFAMA